MKRVDLLIAGGGLGGGLIALALARSRPDLRVEILEGGTAVGGNHTWSFHDGDLDPEAATLVEPLVAARWSSQATVFPRFARVLDRGYRSVTSDRFSGILRQAPVEIRTGAPVVDLTPTTARTADGVLHEAGAVIDARGWQPSPHMRLGWQVFRGLELRLAQPVAPSMPTIMDATVPQEGGFRFVYTLPFAPDRVLVETTVYADGPIVDHDALGRAALAYAADRGWPVAEVLRTEDGVLPITLSGNPEAFWAEADGIPRAGLRAGLFHPVTGYSLPEAAHLAVLIAGLADFEPQALFASIRNHALARWQDQRFYRALNRMLFLAAAPARRVEVLQHFYRLPDDLVGRFYAGRSTALDKLRILSGRPPVPIGAALKALASPHPKDIHP